MAHQYHSGGSVAEVVGPYTWGLIHKAVEDFPCAPCADEGATFMRYIHDVVNLKLDKPLFDAENFDDMHGLINGLVNSKLNRQDGTEAAAREILRMFPGKTTGEHRVHTARPDNQGLGCTSGAASCTR